MVKYSGRVTLQSGGKKNNKAYSGKGCNGVNISKKGNKYDCGNEIYGYKKGGKKGKGFSKNYCKKHFDQLKPSGWTKDNKIWVVYPKEYFKKKNKIQVCQKSGCVTIAHDSKDDILMCKFHFDRHF